MSAICVTPDEIDELTQRMRPTSQYQALNDIRLPARLRPNNAVCVLRSDLMPVDNATRSNRETDEPDFRALRNGS